MAAPKFNQNAVKDIKSDDILHIRINSKLKQSARKKAVDNKMSLSKYVQGLIEADK